MSVELDPVSAALSLADLAPVERMGGAEWAERERVLSTEESPAPGPWRSVPWQRGILDALADPLIVFLVILKAAQMGVSELVRCAIGRWALLDPGDALWVMTTQDAAEASMRKLQAMFRSTPALAPLVSTKSGSTRLLQMVLTNGMKITIGWAGSPQSMASDPQRYCVLDEAAKYPVMGKGGEANAVAFAHERTKVWGRRGKRIVLSSPKHDNDLVVKNHRECEDRRVFAVPCGACGLVQPATWGATRWRGGEPATAPVGPEERLRLAAEIERTGEVWLECSGCSEKIDLAKAARDSRACWVQEEGSSVGGGRRGYHVTELLHWETTPSALVAKFLRCVDPSSLQGFYNGSLGTPLEDEQTLIPASLYTQRAIYPDRLVPSWATAVIATADTQLRGWWWMVRAWGPGRKSRLLDFGHAENEEELLARTLNGSFKVEGLRRDVPGGQEGEDMPVFAKAEALGIDTGGGMDKGQDGSRTADAYRLVLKTPGAIALKGDRDHPDTPPWRRSTRTISHESFDQELELFLVNKNHFADNVARLVRNPSLWEECRLAATDPRYARQMASEKKVQIESETDAGARKVEHKWVKRSQARENHAWDLARYQYALVDYLQIMARTIAPWKLPPELPDNEPDWGTGARRPGSRWS